MRDALLSAASDLLAKEGAEALTVRRIAAEAGVSTMGVYSRFGNKDGVVDALLRQGFEGLREAIESVPVTDDPMADLRECCQAYRQFGLGHAMQYRVMFEGAVTGFVASEESLVVASATFEAVADRVGRCLGAGQLRSGDRHQIAASLWAACHGLVSLELTGHKPLVLGDDEPYDRTMAAMILGFSDSG